MASRKPDALAKPVIIDGEVYEVPTQARIIDVVPKDVTAVQVFDPSGKAKLLSREQFNAPVPAGFTTYQTPVARGAAG